LSDFDDVLKLSDWNFQSVLKNINWNHKRDAFFTDHDGLLILENHHQILAHWSRALETIYSDSPALPFIREAQVSAQDFICVCSLGLYKNSASSIRTIFESTLYFSYFKDHLVELASVTRNKFHLSRSKIINYHIEHTPNFGNLYSSSNLEQTLDKMYSEVSNIVHSSQPGIWHQSEILGKKEYNKAIAKEAILLFKKTINVINLLLLCTLTYEEWITINPVSRKLFLKKITNPQMQLINKQVL
jgi:hypothetical protein